MISSDEYFVLTGEEPGADFAACEALAEELLHAHTLFAYVGRDLDALPEWLSSRLRRAVALQTLAISEAGGVAGAAEQTPGAASLGSFSVSGLGSDTPLCPAVRAVLPILMAYGKICGGERG